MGTRDRRRPTPSTDNDAAFGTADGIVAAVRRALARPARLGATRLVAVDGPSGSGKTSLAGPLARALAEAVDGDVIQPERRFIQPERRVIQPERRVNHTQGRTVDTQDAARTIVAQDDSSRHMSDAPSRSGGRRPLVAVVSTDLLATWEHPLDWWPTLDEQLLAPIAGGITAQLPVVQWVSGIPRPGGVIIVPPVDVLVLEGVSSGRLAVADRLSALVWVEVADRAVRLERAVARDGDAMRPHLARWQADEDAHFASDGSRHRADVIIAPDES